MNKTEQAQQLRLAAELIETGHPFFVAPRPNGLWCSPRSDEMDVMKWPLEKWEIRPALASPPDRRPLHNPDGLSAEQVGLGYRLGLQEESANQPHEVWTNGEWRKAMEGKGAFMNYIGTYRLQLSVPWPEAKPDPYAELKAAHAAGKVIQCVSTGRWVDLTSTPAWSSYYARELRIKPDPYAELKAAHAAGKVIQEDFFGAWHDVTDRDPNWSLAPWLLRIKPEPTAFQLPPPPPGMKWHREDGWKMEDLPQGYRPCALHEIGEYEIRTASWASGAYPSLPRPGSQTEFYRTTRPLIFTHEGKEWTYHRPGDPMPCEPKALIEAVYGAHCDSRKAKDYNWDAWTSVFGWRYAETTKTVELGPEDVPPLSVIRRKSEKQNWHWRLISYVHGTHAICADRAYEWSELERDYEINRSIPLTGKWDANAWEPCSKEVQA